jgi:two-component system LytT family sensor kinase
MSGEVTGFLAGFCVAVLPLLAAGFWLGRRTARPRDSLGGLGTPVEHATVQTLHTATLAAPPLRAGLTEETARRSAKRLRTLLGTDALCLTDHESVLAWEGVAEHHRAEIMGRLAGPLETGRGEAFRLTCDIIDCPVRWAVVAPLTVDDRVHGALVACAPRESAVLVRAAGEVARWVSVQLELADLDQSRTRLIEAEIKALRAQISRNSSSTRWR